MFHVDIGLYFKFGTTWYGRPTGCSGMNMHDNWKDEDDQVWLCNEKSRMTGGGANMRDDVGCMLNDHADGGDKPMYQIVEDYANDQMLWVQDFTQAIDKQLSNGYADGDLVDGPSVFGTHVTCQEGQNGIRVTCTVQD